MKDYRVPTVNESVSERPQAPGGSMMHERDAEPPETIMTPDGRLAEILEEISAQVYGVHAIVIGDRNGDACHDGRRQDHPKPLPPESGRHHDPCRLVERRDHEPRRRMHARGRRGPEDRARIPQLDHAPALGRDPRALGHPAVAARTQRREPDPFRGDSSGACRPFILLTGAGTWESRSSVRSLVK